MSYIGQVSGRAMQAGDIGANAVTTVKINDDAVDADKLASNAVVSASIVDGAIVNADVNASAALDATKIADGTVTSAEFQFINSLSSNAQTQLTNRLPLAGGTMSGALQMADQQINRAFFMDYAEVKTNLVAAATVDIDLTVGNVFQLTADQNTTFTFSNPPATGRSGAFTLRWTQDSSDRTITWPATVDWAGGSAPDVTAGSAKVDIYTFFHTRCRCNMVRFSSWRGHELRRIVCL